MTMPTTGDALRDLWRELSVMDWVRAVGLMIAVLVVMYWLGLFWLPMLVVHGVIGLVDWLIG